MAMTDIATPELRALLAGLPPIGPGTELILRPDPRGATATLRPEGAPPRVFVHDAAGVTECRPQDDTGLPGARLLADRALLQERLRPCLGTVTAARLVAWRPGRRAVLRVTDATGTAHWLKLLDRKAHRRAVAAFAAIGDTLSPLCLALPTHLLDDVCAFVAANAPGRSLRHLIADRTTTPLTLVTQALLALGYTDLRGELPLLDFAHARQATVAMLARAAAAHPGLADLGERVARLPSPPLAPVGFVHGDLHDKQLFVAGDRVTLIDIEGVGAGDPRFDHANLAEHVRLRDLQQDGRDGGLSDVLLARCGLTADDPAAVLFRAVIRARLCGVYALRPRWRPLVDLLLQETRRLMECVR